MDGHSEGLVEASARLADARGSLSDDLAAEFFLQFPLERILQCVFFLWSFGCYMNNVGCRAVDTLLDAASEQELELGCNGIGM